MHVNKAIQTSEFLQLLQKGPCIVSRKVIAFMWAPSITFFSIFIDPYLQFKPFNIFIELINFKTLKLIIQNLYRVLSIVCEKAPIGKQYRPKLKIWILTYILVSCPIWFLSLLAPLFFLAFLSGDFKVLGPTSWPQMSPMSCTQSHLS